MWQNLELIYDLYGKRRILNMIVCFDIVPGSRGLVNQCGYDKTGTSADHPGYLTAYIFNRILMPGLLYTRDCMPLQTPPIDKCGVNNELQSLLHTAKTKWSLFIVTNLTLFVCIPLTLNQCFFLTFVSSLLFSFLFEVCVHLPAHAHMCAHAWSSFMYCISFQWLYF